MDARKTEEIDPGGGPVAIRRNDRMHEQLALTLARDILAGRRPEGSQIPSSDALVKEYGVSRTVARETVQALAGAGLVSLQHGKRTLVQGISQWRFLDTVVQEALAREKLPPHLVAALYEPRIALELASVRACAHRATDEELRQVVDQAAAMEHVLEKPGGKAEFTACDLAFHYAIAKGTGNLVHAGMVRDIHRGLSGNRMLDALDPAEVALVAKEHRAIADALMARDQERAVGEMSSHLERTKRQHTAGSASSDGDEARSTERFAS
jgi:DNA-binding FadR family transcriptional regulator